MPREYSPANTGRWLSREEETARQKAYKECNTDEEAAARVGMGMSSFAAWRRARELPTKRSPGQAKHMTEAQEWVLEFLREHPWSRHWDIAKTMDKRSWTVHGYLRRLETKDLIDVCLVDRVKRWALAGTPPPDRGMKLKRGAPSLYHAAHVPQRVLRILEK